MRMNCRARLPWATLCGLSVCLAFGVICAGQTPSNSQPPETSPAVTKIAGTVVSAVTGAPLPQTRVSIADTRNRANMLWMVTNESGRFEFDRLPPGKYSLVGAKRGFLNGAYQQHEQFSTAVVTGTEFDTTQLVLRLTPMASIDRQSGRRGGRSGAASPGDVVSREQRNGIWANRTCRTAG